MDWIKIDINGEDYKVDSRTITIHGCYDIYKNIIPEENSLKEIKKICDKFNENDIFLDVGCNTGLMSLMINKGICHSFDPIKECCEITKNNAVLNNKHIIVHNKACYDKKINYTLNLNEDMHGRSSISESKEGEKALVLDDLEFTGKVKLIKVDAEGCDSNVLKGAINIIKKDKPIIMVEHADKEWLKELNYKQIGSTEGLTIWSK